LLACLGGELEVWPFNDCIHRAGLLTQAAVDALHHVNIVARRAPRAVVAARAGLDGDGVGRADRFTQLAGNAALLAVGITAQSVLAAEARTERSLLIGVVDRRLRRKEVAHREEEGRDEL